MAVRGFFVRDGDFAAALLDEDLPPCDDFGLADDLDEDVDRVVFFAAVVRVAVALLSEAMTGLHQVFANSSLYHERVNLR